MKGKGKRWTKREVDYLKENYGILPILEISKKLKRTVSSVQDRITRLGLRKITQREYAVYFGDNFSFTGNGEEVQKTLGISESTLRFYLTETHAKRAETGVFIVYLGRWRKEA